jgi:hypothetical protein
MERIQAYSSPTSEGGIHVDTEGMAVDLITVMKVGGYTKEMFTTMISELWDQVEVEVDTTKVKKDS